MPRERKHKVSIRSCWAKETHWTLGRQRWLEFVRQINRDLHSIPTESIADNKDCTCRVKTQRDLPQKENLVSSYRTERCLILTNQNEKCLWNTYDIPETPERSHLSSGTKLALE